MSVQTKYEIVIGLEVHLQLNTKTKIFCGCANRFGFPANSLTCPVCLGQPGVLPVFNQAVLDSGIKLALALECQIAPVMKFDRKNYFYPDLPKNYQISQYDVPMASSGFVALADGKKIRLERIHIEEDAGKSVHDRSESSCIDYNRTGTPLLEIVSRPDISSPDEAYAYLTELKSVCAYLGISDCNMEEGSLRCDANLSLRLHGDRELGVKTELKNMNSFKGVKQALVFESERQAQALDAGEKIVQETRLWDDAKKTTRVMRTKEGASDYRYFPDPDLPPFKIEEKLIANIRSTLPEMRQAKSDRFQKVHELSDYDASVLTQEKSLADAFESVVEIFNEPKEVANWFLGPVLALINGKNTTIDALKFSPESIAKMLKLIKSGAISNSIAKKDILPAILFDGADVESLVKSQDLSQISDEDSLLPVVREVIEENPKSAADYKSGKKNAAMFLMGQVMKKTKGKANPQMLKDLIVKVLDQ